MEKWSPPIFCLEFTFTMKKEKKNVEYATLVEWVGKFAVQSPLFTVNLETKGC